MLRTKKKLEDHVVDISRRRFLTTAGKASTGFVGGLLLLRQTGSLAFAARGGSACELAPARYELRFDPHACAGCNICETACAQFHAGHMDPYESRNDFVLKPIVEFIGVSALSANAPGWPQPLATATFEEYSENSFCRQCASPECLDACPENAIYVDKATGARLVDENKCIGCGSCAQACQFNKIKVNPNTGVAVKCDFCGGNPQCAAWCPIGAITFHKL